MKHLKSIIALMSISMALAAQQSQTTIDTKGNKQVVDAATGWTLTEKGKTMHQAPAELNSLCSNLESPTRRATLTDETVGTLRQICEIWAEVQPKTQIVKVPFSSLIDRLLLVAPASSDFARYRGMELNSVSDTTTFDATILPNDVIEGVSCEIEEENRHTLGMMYTYSCIIKTPSFPEAVSLKERLVQSLATLRLGEDEVREHGLSTNARKHGFCAPTGECLEGDPYVSETKNYKTLQIEANPDLTRDAIADDEAMKNGQHSPIKGMSSNSAEVSFEVFSVGPLKTNSVSKKK